MSEINLHELVQNLPLPDIPERPFLPTLKSLLKKLGFEVNLFNDVRGWLEDQKVFVHHRAVNGRGSIALLHVPDEIISHPKSLWALDFIGVKFVENDNVNGIFFFSGAKELSIKFDLLANSWVRPKSTPKGAKIFKYEVIEYMASLGDDEFGLENVKTLLLFDQIFPPPITDVDSTGGVDGGLEISQDHFNLLVEILMKKAEMVDPFDPRKYYWSLLNEAALSENFRRVATNFKQDSKLDAQLMLRRALSEKRNSEAENYTTLGSLLKPLLKPDEIEDEQQRAVAEIIYRYKLYINQQELDELATRFNLPR